MYRSEPQSCRLSLDFIPHFDTLLAHYFIDAPILSTN